MNEILNIQNVHGYLDKDTGTAYINAEDVARGFGFTQLKNGIEYIRWETLNGYLKGYGFSQHVGKNDFLPENMVYRLGFKASNETAQKFQAILADEVLPAIRKHGAYMTDDALKKAIQTPEFLIELATTLKQEKEARQKAEHQLEAQKPKIIFAEAVSASDDVISIGKLANMLHQNGIDTGRNRLITWMRANGYLFKQGRDNNKPTQKAMDLGLFKIKETIIHNADGSIFISTTSLVTGKGQQYFINKFLNKTEQDESEEEK